jgi:starch synthase
VEELKDPFYGERLDDLFRSRAERMHGILNGIDTEFYDPAADPELVAPYSAADPAGKALCKAALRRELGLDEEDSPIVAMIGRLTEQKGLDLLERVLPELLEKGLQLVVLGTGEGRYEEMLRQTAQHWPGRLYAGLRFDEGLSHRVYAGADLLLMPSLFEPCGLSQMIAMRYGTLPVVRETGGLRDSVVPYNRYTGEGTGFSFANYNAHEMMFTLLDAVELYHSDRTAWQGLVNNAMSVDFGWNRAARQYLELYQQQCGQS